MRYLILVIALLISGQFASATAMPFDSTDVVTLVSPLPNETLKNAPIRFKWNRIENAINYTLIVFADTIGNEHITFFQVGDTSKVVFNLPFDSTMSWTVSARDDINSLTSKRQLFRIAKPYPLKLISPPDSTKQDYPVELLSWHSVPYVTSYEVEVVKADTYEHQYTQQSISNDTTLSLPLTSLGSHLWHVRPIWQDSIGAYSLYWNFQIYNKFPDPPMVSTPRDSAVFTQVDSLSKIRIFEWNYDGGAIRYQIQLSYTSEFDSLVIDDSLTARTYTVTLPFREGAHYWRVRLQHAIGWTEWSEVRVFFMHFLNHVQTDKTREVYLYPNPSTNYVNIVGIVDDIADVRLTDVLGKSYIVLPVYQNGSVRLEIDEIPPGIYLLRITTDKGEQTIQRIAVEK
jgi:hypothetical protein